MSSKARVEMFIRSTFRSVWSLEMLLHLKRESGFWSAQELVGALRGSQLIVAQGMDALFAAGLIEIDGDGRARYQPASIELGQFMDEAEALYVRSPDAVRRMIVNAAQGSLAAFAAAFQLKKD